MKLPSFILIIVFAFSCKSEKEIQTVQYGEIKSGLCSADSAHSYLYSLPDHFTGKLPLLIILDPGGNGLFAVTKVKPAAGKTPCILVGSDLIKNNFPGYVQAIGTLIGEAIHRFDVNPDQVFLAGFSGGARMAFEYARQFPVKGVLMCGAGPSVGFNSLPCPVYMIAGTTDFNFGEMFYNPFQKTSENNFFADYFRGGHEWPPPATLENALILLTGKPYNGLFKFQSRLLTEKADSLLQSNETLLAVMSVENALALDPKNKTALKLREKLKNDRKHARQLNKLQSNLNLERKIGQAYAQATLTQDSIWWAREINRLLKEINSSQGENEDHFMRIKSFLGILFYSRINSMINSDKFQSQTENLLSAYRLAEPANPDVYFFYALFEKQKGETDRSNAYLRKAVNLGLKDHSRIEASFPEFEN